MYECIFLARQRGGATLVDDLYKNVVFVSTKSHFATKKPCEMAMRGQKHERNGHFWREFSTPPTFFCHFLIKFKV